MEQVRILNKDKAVHPVAPIVLAGAALEIALRSAIEELGLEPPVKHSISAYSGCLRAPGFLSVQDVTDVDQMGGVRNSAAHGRGYRVGDGFGCPWPGSARAGSQTHGDQDTLWTRFEADR
jgi:hypothetical protein